MKKFLLSFIVLTMSMTAAVITVKTSNKSQFNANIEALASSESGTIDAIALCNAYCYDRSGYQCVLVTKYGFDIICEEMYIR